MSKLLGFNNYITKVTKSYMNTPTMLPEVLEGFKVLLQTKTKSYMNKPNMLPEARGRGGFTILFTNVADKTGS